MFATRWSCQHKWLSAFPCLLLVFCFTRWAKFFFLCSRCEWLVAVGCRERVQVPAQPPWLTGRSWVESRHQCPGDPRPGSPYEALLKGQGGFWGNPAQLWLYSFIYLFNYLTLVLTRTHLHSFKKKKTHTPITDVNTILLIAVSESVITPYLPRSAPHLPSTILLDCPNSLPLKISTMHRKKHPRHAQ